MKRFAETSHNKRMIYTRPVKIPVIEFTRRLLMSGGISARGLLLLHIYYIKLLLVIPASILQFFLYSSRIRKTLITKQPVFILGHYRSGTTFLHKLMASDHRLGFLNNFDMICPNSSLLFGNWLQKLLQLGLNRYKIKTSFFNNKIPDLSEPAEEERFLINRGSAFTDYWRFMFPLNWNKWPLCSEESKDPGYYRRWKKEYLKLLQQITFKNNGRQLILKSPPNTGRIRLLLEMFPGAKFIYISRNPYHVFYSTRNLWNRAIRKFCLQDVSDAQVEEIIFNEYRNLLDLYEKDKKLIPHGNLIEVQYDQLEANPVNLLRSIYEELDLGDFESILKNLHQVLKRESRYQKFEYDYSEEILGKIKNRWGKYCRKWDEVAADVSHLL